MRFRPSALSLALALSLSCANAFSAAPPARKPAPKAPTKPAAAAKPAASATRVATSPEAIALLEKGIAATQAGQSAVAEEAFRQAMAKMAPGDPNFLVPYDSLGKIYFRQENYQGALPFVQKAQPLIVSRYGANSIQAAEGLQLLANIQQHLGNPAAMETYRKSVSIFELPQNVSTYSKSYTTALQNLGTGYSRQGNPDMALRYYLQALEIMQRNGDAETGRVLENIGINHQNRNDTEKAAGYYQQALKAYEKNGEKANYQNLQFRLANLRPDAAPAQTVGSAPAYDGHYYEAGRKAYNESRYQEAAGSFKQALAQVQKYHPKEERFIATLKEYIGKSLLLGDSDEDGEPYLEQALATVSKTNGAASEEVVSLHLALASAENQKGEYTEAERHLNHVLANQAQGTAMRAAAQALMAETISHQGRFAESRLHYAEALAFYKSQTPVDAKRIAGIEYQMSLLDKMFQTQAQNKAQYFNYEVSGLRHWNAENPVIYVRLTDGAGLPNWNEKYRALAEKAFAEWEKSLGGRHSFQFTNDPGHADVNVTWTDKPISETDVHSRVGLFQLEHTRGFMAKSDIILSFAANGRQRDDVEIYATALHEIGHMLGLPHSNNLADIMAEIVDYSSHMNKWPSLTQGDIEAARYLYSQKAAITNPKGITVAEYRRFNEVAQSGVEAFKRSNYREASRIFENARTLYAEDPFINFFYGVSAFERGEYDDARDIFETLVMPESSKVFSVDGQLGLIYVELGHKYNRWGKKNRAVSREFYAKGVHHLQNALQNPELQSGQRDYLAQKLREGQQQRRPEPVYTWDIQMSRSPQSYW